jgi:hypothetical protein
MIVLAQVEQILMQVRPDLLPHAPLLLQIANIYINGDDTFELYVEQALQQLASPHGNVPHGSVASVVRNRFVDCCENTWPFDNADQLRTQAMALAVAGPPGPPGPPPPPHAQAQAPPEYAEYVARLRWLRTGTSRVRGGRLAEAARLMDGWFHWVPSGPVPAPDVHQAQKADQVQPVGPMFGPKEHWQQDDGGMRQNDFARWVNGGDLPSQQAHMNCWEAVLFSAFRANLVTLTWLQTIHRKAAMINEFIHERTGGGEVNYYRALSQALGFVDSVPFVPPWLVPHPGDVLFWEQTEHIAIALGRRWVNGISEDHIMSHWHNNDWHDDAGRFSALTLEDLPVWLQTDFRFVPCPF